MKGTPAPSPEAVQAAVDRLLMASAWAELPSLLAGEPLLLTEAALRNLYGRAGGAEVHGALDSRIRMLTLAYLLHLGTQHGVEKGMEDWVAKGMHDVTEFLRWSKDALRGDPEVSLEGELDLARQTLWLAHYGDGPFGRFWNNLITLVIALLQRWAAKGNTLAAWKEIYRWRKRDLARVDDGSPDWPAKAADLARAAGGCFTFGGDPEYNDEAIALLNASRARRDDAKVRSDLARALIYRFELSGRETDLANAAVLAETAARDLTDAADQATALDRAGMALADAYTLRGDAKLLEMAIERQTLAVELAPAESESRPGHMGNLAGSLAQRFGLRGEDADLKQAIELYRAEVALCLPGHTLRPDALANLAGTLLGRGEEGDSREAVGMLREALELAGTAPTVPLWRSQLGQALVMSGDAKGAVIELTAALERVGDEHPDRASILALLADAEAAAGLDAAARYRAAVEAGAANQPTAALAAAQRGARWAIEHQHLDVARDLYSRGLDVLDATAGKQTKIADALAWRRSAALLVDEGAVALALGGEVEPAIHHLERGRAAILRRSLRARDVSESAVDLPAITDVQPLLLLVAGTSTGVALHISRGNSRAVRLPGLTREEVVMRVLELFSVQQMRHEAGGALRWHERLEAATAWLYDTIFDPLIAEVGPLGPRLVLGVDGLLGALPFAAAWTPDPDAAGGRRSVIDTTALTVVPSALSLGAAMKASATVPRKSVVIATPANTSLADLEWATVEAAEVAKILPGCVLLEGGDATREKVAAELENADVVHVAAHGQADLLNPLQSGVVLADGKMLTVADLLGQPARTRRLAVLSACETSVAGAVVPTEAVGLPAAFLSLGYAGVLGTLWPVSDAAARLLIPQTMRAWLAGRPLAEALAESQRWLRHLPADEAEALLNRTVASEYPFAAARSWAAFTLTGV
jgi:CHAT domain-containing protein